MELKLLHQRRSCLFVPPQLSTRWSDIHINLNFEQKIETQFLHIYVSYTIINRESYLLLLEEVNMVALIEIGLK